MCQMPEGRPGYAKAKPPGRDKIANAPPAGLTTRANVPRLPGCGGGGWALLELTDAQVLLDFRRQNT